jgi:hypothetical protein
MRKIERVEESIAASNKGPSEVDWVGERTNNTMKRMGKKRIRQYMRENHHAWLLQDGEEKNLPLTGHLEELRYRIIVVFVTMEGFCALYPFF